MPSSADIVIVGGGVVGSSVAYHLREVGCRGRIVVIERDDTYARASSNLAMGGVRQQFTLDTNVRMVQWSVGFHRDLERRASLTGSPHRVSFQQAGYLFLADANCAARLARRYEAMRSAGAHVEWVSRDEIRRTLPDAAVDDIEFGLFGPDDGYANPKAVLRAMRAIAEDAGVEYIRGDVSAIPRTTNRVTGVAFGTDAIDTPIVVNAAGPFAGRIAELAGVSLLCSRCASNYSAATCPANGSIAFPW